MQQGCNGRKKEAHVEAEAVAALLAALSSLQDNEGSVGGGLKGWSVLSTLSTEACLLLLAELAKGSLVGKPPARGLLESKAKRRWPAGCFLVVMRDAARGALLCCWVTQGRVTL